MELIKDKKYNIRYQYKEDNKVYVKTDNATWDGTNFITDESSRSVDLNKVKKIRNIEE